MDRVRKIVNAEWAHRNGYTGSGITVAIMDTGIAAHIDLNTRVVGFVDYVNGRKGAYDDNGHGTHVAGILGGSGFASHGKYTGIAPGCNILSIKVLDHLGNGNTRNVIRALNWLLKNREKYKIRILNISVGMLSVAKMEEQKILLGAVEEAWNAGIVVVAAAGNNGPYKNSVTIPGLSKTVITVGSSDDDVSGIRRLGLVKGYSGRGPTQSCVMKPEIVAPGTAITSCSRLNNLYAIKSGTSMSTPIVAGAMAVLSERNPSLQPADMKLCLHETAEDIGKDKHIQGWGLVDVGRLIK